MLPGALRERGAEIADEFVASNLLGVGQFCTNPGLVVVLGGNDAEAFISSVAAQFEAAPVGTLLGPSAAKSFGEGVTALIGAGAELVVGGQPGGGRGCCYQNTLLRTTGAAFIGNPDGEGGFQTEIFGNGALKIVVVSSREPATSSADVVCSFFVPGTPGLPDINIPC
jgi:alpha-ketoglutaric semialdehyde dehydrogenase